MSKKSNAALCYDCLLTQVCQRKNVRDLRRIPKCLLRHSIGRASGADVVRDAAPRLERAGVHGRPPEVPAAHLGARGGRGTERAREWACALSPPDRRTSRSVSSSSASTRSPRRGPRARARRDEAPGGVGDDVLLARELRAARGLRGSAHVFGRDSGLAVAPRRRFDRFDARGDDPSRDAAVNGGNDRGSNRVRGARGVRATVVAASRPIRRVDADARRVRDARPLVPRRRRGRRGARDAGRDDETVVVFREEARRRAFRRRAPGDRRGAFAIPRPRARRRGVLADDVNRGRHRGGVPPRARRVRGRGGHGGGGG